jgi:hypothetical protein
MPTRSSAPATRRLRLSLDTWAVLTAATILILIIVGTLPRVPW